MEDHDWGEGRGTGNKTLPYISTLTISRIICYGLHKKEKDFEARNATSVWESED